MNTRSLSRRLVGLCAAAAALSALIPAGASAATNCTAPTLTQPFSTFGDSHQYTNAPGVTYDSFSGNGWVLAGGARFVTTTLLDGNKGYVLDMPSGSTATSPAMCVTNAYPIARTIVRNVSGSVGVNFNVSYLNPNNTWGAAQSTGNTKGSGTGWTPSGYINIHPSNVVGWQLARFTLVAGGTGSEYQLYNFYVDPRMS